MCIGPIHTYCLHISSETLKVIHGIERFVKPQGKSSNFTVQVDRMSARYADQHLKWVKKTLLK